MRIGCLLLFEDAIPSPSDAHKNLSGSANHLSGAYAQVVQTEQLEIDEVVIVNTVENAIKILRSRCVDVLIVNIGLRAHEATDNIKKVRAVTAAAILALSKIEDDLLFAEFLKAGADEVLTRREMMECPLRDVILKNITRSQIRECGIRIDSKITQLSQMAGAN